ncbi:MAG: energy transducer TonB [Roseateles sp.]
MESERCRRGLQPRHSLVLAISLVLGMLAPGAGAQELGDLAGKAKLSDAERAKRDADKVMQWIRFHADKADRPVRAAPTREAPPAAAREPAAREPARDVAAAREAAQRAAAVRAATAAGAAPAGRPAPEASAPSEALATGAPTVAPQAPPQLMAAASPSAQPVLPPPAAQAARAPEPPAEEVPLRLLERVEPDFPARLLRERAGGSVTVRFTVQPDGSVRAAEAVNASNKRLVPAVLEAVGRWRFAPIPETRVAVVEVGFRAE